MSETFRVGVTLHSFTNEYCSFQWSFEDMMQKASLLGGGVEIVGPAHHRGFPEVTDEFERTFKSSIERNGLTPTSYGSYADLFVPSSTPLALGEHDVEGTLITVEPYMTAGRFSFYSVCRKRLALEEEIGRNA